MRTPKPNNSTPLDSRQPRSLAKLIGIPDVLNGLARSGGIYAQVLSDGIIEVGDPVIQRVVPFP